MLNTGKVSNYKSLKENIFQAIIRGAAGSRTLVQTYSP